MMMHIDHYPEIIVGYYGDLTNKVSADVFDVICNHM